MSEAENTLKKKRTLPAAAEPYKWKKGFCPNPGGRPRAFIGDIVRQILAEMPKRERKSYAEKLVRDAVKRAMRGSRGHLQELFDRAEGKPSQRIEHSGPDGSAIPVSIEHIDERLLEFVRRARSRAPASGGKS